MFLDLVLLIEGTGGLAELPWATVPETVTRRFGGWLPVRGDEHTMVNNGRGQNQPGIG
jgi:hypothetical protein